MLIMDPPRSIVIVELMYEHLQYREYVTCAFKLKALID